MSEPLTFMMGEFKAEFPSDRLYAKNHMWALKIAENNSTSSENSNPASGDSASGDSASGDSASGDSASGDRASGDRASGDRASGDLVRFGFGAYAVRLLQDVYFLDWTVEAPCELKDRQEMGSIESKKAESSLFAPMRGTLQRLNQMLLDDPSGINVDKYGTGWLFEMQGESSGLLQPEAYIEHLTKVWEITQRTIKGQLNE